MATRCKMPFAAHSSLAKITFEFLSNLFFIVLVFGCGMLVLLLTAMRFLHMVIQGLGVAELPCALVTGQLCDCCHWWNLSAVLLEVFLKNQVIPGGFHVEQVEMFTWKWEVRLLGFTRCLQPATLQSISFLKRADNYNIKRRLLSTFPSSKGISAWVNCSSRYCGWVELFEEPPPAPQATSLFTLFGEAGEGVANGLDGLFFSPCPDFTELSFLIPLSTTSTRSINGEG